MAGFVFVNAVLLVMLECDIFDRELYPMDENRGEINYEMTID